MATWDSYTQKSTPADADTLMIKDTSGGANKRTPFSGVWNWILTKLTNAVISQLETTNKSIIPAINELNSKSILSIGYLQIDEYRNGARLIHGELFQGRGQSFGLEYQYDADSLHYGAQLIISYADGIKFRHLHRSVWSDWEQISAAPLP